MSELYYTFSSFIVLFLEQYSRMHFMLICVTALYQFRWILRMMRLLVLTFFSHNHFFRDQFLNLYYKLLVLGVLESMYAYLSTKLHFVSSMSSSCGAPFDPAFFSHNHFLLYFTVFLDKGSRK
jgi:hypothetical protein